MAGPNSPPPFASSTVEMVCRALDEAIRGHQIANLITVLKVSEDAGEARNTKWRRLFNAVAAAQNRQRDVHPDVLHFRRADLVQQNYFHAVLEASKSVAEKLRDLSGLQGDGAPLVDAACSLSSGRIVAFNALATDCEQSEQTTGLAPLLKGLVGTFRNPTTHAPKMLWATSRRDALDMLTLATMPPRRLDAAT